MKTFAKWFVVVIGLVAVACIGCDTGGGGGDGGPVASELCGTIETTSFQVEAGRTIQVTDHLTIRASSDVPMPPRTTMKALDRRTKWCNLEKNVLCLYIFSTKGFAISS